MYIFLVFLSTTHFVLWLPADCGSVVPVQASSFLFQSIYLIHRYTVRHVNFCVRLMNLTHILVFFQLWCISSIQTKETQWSLMFSYNGYAFWLLIIIFGPASVGHPLFFFDDPQLKHLSEMDLSWAWSLDVPLFFELLLF